MLTNSQVSQAVSMAEKVSEVVQVGIVNKPVLPDSQEVTIPDPETESVDISVTKSAAEKSAMIAQIVTEKTCKTTKPVAQPDDIIHKHIVQPEGRLNIPASQPTGVVSISSVQSHAPIETVTTEA
eukprot:522949_1